MALKTAKQVNAMQAKYRTAKFPAEQRQENIQEAYFDRTEVLQLLDTLQTRYVKVSLALLPTKTPQMTIVMVGVDTVGGRVQEGSDGLVADIPCPPTCGTTIPARAKIIISG